MSDTVKLPPLPRVGPICYVSAQDVLMYVVSPSTGTHLPGVRDVALWSTDQIRDYARDAVALNLALSSRPQSE